MQKFCQEDVAEDEDDRGKARAAGQQGGGGGGAAIKMQTQVANPENGVSWGSLDAPCWKIIPSQSSTARHARHSPDPLATCHMPLATQWALVAHPLLVVVLLQFAVKGRAATTTVNAIETPNGKWYWQPPMPHRWHEKRRERCECTWKNKGIQRWRELMLKGNGKKIDK